MPCCGQGRAELRASTNATPRQNARTAVNTPAIKSSGARPVEQREATATAALPPAAHGEVALRYLAQSSIIVVGPVSGRQYRFSGAAPIQRVARADQASLLATGHFRRES
jgi:hypothetical protein